MKKFFAVLLMLTMVFTFCACGGDTASSGNDSGDTASGIDMSAFPADVNEWTGQNFIDYFKAQGLFTDDSAHETWLQDHANYWPQTPVSECAGWWDLVGNVVFAYTTMTLDDECLAKCEAAYEQFLSDTGATAEF